MISMSRSRFAITMAVVLAVVIITIFSGIEDIILAWIFVACIVLSVLLFEIYIFFSYISNRFGTCFVHVFLKIDGTNDESVMMKVDGKITRKFIGRYDGVVKLRNGERRIMFFNDKFSTEVNLIVEDNVSFDLRIEGNIATLDVGHKTMNGTEEEIRLRLKRYKKVNAFLFVIVNFLMVCAVLRVLAIFDVI